MKELESEVLCTNSTALLTTKELWFLIPSKTRFFVLESVHISSKLHIASNSMNTGDIFPGDKMKPITHLHLVTKLRMQYSICLHCVQSDNITLS
jgi:hypothetical protein